MKLLICHDTLKLNYRLNNKILFYSKGIYSSFVVAFRSS